MGTSEERYNRGKEIGDRVWSWMRAKRWRQIVFWTPTVIVGVLIYGILWTAHTVLSIISWLWKPLHRVTLFELLLSTLVYREYGALPALATFAILGWWSSLTILLISSMLHAFSSRQRAQSNARIQEWLSNLKKESK